MISQKFDGTRTLGHLVTCGSPQRYRGLQGWERGCGPEFAGGEDIWGGYGVGDPT